LHHSRCRGRGPPRQEMPRRGRAPRTAPACDRARPASPPRSDHRLRSTARPDRDSTDELLTSRTPWACVPRSSRQSASSSRLEVKRMDLDIAEVAQRSGVPASTLRFYEEKGLIASIGRRGLRRLFDAEVLERLSLIALG